MVVVGGMRKVRSARVPRPDGRLRGAAPVSKAVRAAHLRRDEEVLAKAATPEGWKPLLEAGIEAATRHQTTTAELLRVLLSGAS